MDTSVLVFFLYPFQAPRCSLLLLLELCAPLTVNAQLVFECRTGPLSLGFLPVASLCFWVDVACSLVSNGLKPWGAHSWAYAGVFKDAVLFKASKDVAGWHSGSPFTWLSLCSRANRMHGGGGAKWAAIPSLTLVEQKMTHASSQSWTCFPVRWL